MASLIDELKPKIPPKVIKPIEIVDTVEKKEPKPNEKLKRFRMVYMDEEGNEFSGTKKDKIMVGADGRVIAITDESQLFSDDKFKIPKRLNYRVEYYLNDMISQIDFNYINYGYQPFTGGGGPIYLNPGFNVFFQLGVNDLMEDHRFVGGVRLNFSLINNEYLFSYSNLKKRLDKEVVFHRNTLEGYVGYTLVRVHSHELFYILKWPFTEALSLRGTAMYRNDMYVALATDQISLEIPNRYDNWAGLKAELVFDNTRSLGMNLYKGLRYKLFAEYHQLIDFDNADRNLIVLGFDVRPVSYTHLRAHETLISISYAVFCL